MPSITGVHHVSLSVTDLDRSTRWYSDGDGAIRDPDDIQLELFSGG